ncbi:Predicted arabinose efflux permease, MFS family [Saccharopolyspora antimicrobica]|uniref:MFS family arabinose efflux permease n=1 Tax=Saccharopolyspora antimicrobica TaxID=455193 RepID=A0A1I5EJ07_9PSEU|nr:MFS transporter [Saccharopolyspora antimicrobica]RKT86833.1 putative MFS family arabinose efflux permease [Saccharopolyspora antimicrobica]SFO11316.1 Predicted arabinose efflux permease, MFS family [Saccharopolyspora antimicrobica]
MTLGSAAPAPPDPASRKAVGPAVVIGSALEWFDFYLYASMAALVFGRLFFPSGDPTTATLGAMATFAVGFLARPFGGIVFGVLGDKFGRKMVLSVTFLLMGISSGLIGLLPTYESVGLFAPLLLVVLRLLQGLGAGAELGSAIAVAYEHADAKSRGRLGSLPALGVNIGLFASSLTVTVLTSFDDEFLYSWGWRIPFVASFALVALGFWVRRQMPETPEFEREAREASSRKKSQPLRSLIRSDWRGLAVVLAITVGYNGVSYVFKTFSLSYLTEFRDVPANVGSFGITLASACAIITVPIAGRLCDRVGSKTVVMVGAVATAALAFPFFWMLDSGQRVLIWAALVLATGIVVPAMLSAQGAFLSQQFPTRTRASGLGTGREVGGAFSGGLAPLAALALVTATPGHGTWAVSLMFVAGAAFIGVGALFDQAKRLESRAEQQVAERT